MRQYVARLIDTGMTRETALVICRYYVRLGKMDDLAQYVRDVEEECRVRLDDV